MNNPSVREKAIFRWTSVAMMMAIALATNNTCAEESCAAWRGADVDPTGGKYLLELRICDLTYGLSAFVQIKNSSDSRVALSYRLTTQDEQTRDESFTLEPLSTTRVVTCQACAKRHAGFKSWEILSVKELEKIKTVVPQSAVPSTPVVVEKPKPEEKPVLTEQVPASVVLPPGPSSLPPKDAEKKRESFKAEDGTVIPYDQLPPEFRPRK